MKRWLLRQVGDCAAARCSLWRCRAQALIQRATACRRTDFDVVFLMPPYGTGWILEAIAREIARRSPYRVAVHCRFEDVPSARLYVFTHQSYVPEFVRRSPRLLAAKTVVYYTHPSHYIEQRMARAFMEACDVVVCQCSLMRRHLLRCGFQAGQVRFLLTGGADPDLFQPSAVGQRGAVVGMVSAYVNRKRPGLMLAVMRMMPETPFLLLGRGWRSSPWWKEMEKLSNLEYVEAPYEDYPDHYRRMRVFLSTSYLEGGPIPLLEAMMSGVVPVVSDTGFAGDVIQDGVNGYCFPHTASADQVAARIRDAWFLDVDVRSTVIMYDWDRVARRYHELFDQLLHPHA